MVWPRSQRTCTDLLCDFAGDSSGGFRSDGSCGKGIGGGETEELKGDLNHDRPHTLSHTAFATAAAALAAAWAAWVSQKGIRAASRIADQSREDFRLSLAAELSMKLDDRFNSEEFKETRSQAAEALLQNQESADAEDVFDFFETVGLLVRTGAVTKELAYNFFFHWINLYWVAGQRYIQAKDKTAKSLWEDFDYLYVLVREVEKTKDPNSEDLKLAEQPQRLEKYLRVEVTAKDQYPIKT